MLNSFLKVELESHLIKNAKIRHANGPAFKLKYLKSGWSYSQASNKNSLF